jgi:hypothetical protein
MIAWVSQSNGAERPRRRFFDGISQHDRFRETRPIDEPAAEPLGSVSRALEIDPTSH